MEHTRILEMRFSADPKKLRMVRERVQKAAQQIAFSKKQLSDLVIAVNEACMNIMQHGYKGDRNGEILLEISDQGEAVEVVLTDYAAPADLASIEPRKLDEVRPGGLGTYFMSELMDDCAY
ncbi:MAG: ATP-binding protein, partial [Pseudomonadota bacterium]